MSKWEYQVLNQSRKFEGALVGAKFGEWAPTIDLTRIGSDGWELVTVIPTSSHDGSAYAGNTTELQWVFKRSSSNG